MVTKAEDFEQHLDCSNNKKNLWLVKVPKYLSETWQKEAGTGEVGKLRVEPDGSVSLESAASPSAPAALNIPGVSNAFPWRKQFPAPVVPVKPAGKKDVPKAHRFMISDLGANMSFAVFSEDKTELAEEDKPRKSGRVVLEGRVVKRAEVRPPPSATYMKLKKEAIEDASKPTRSIMQMDRAAVKYKPVNIHAEMAVKEKMKKDSGKSVRMDKDHVLNLIFNAFEKHQYYKLVDLASLIKQPGAYVKELLQEVGHYCMTPPHKHLWELKPEYRHYKN